MAAGIDEKQRGLGRRGFLGGLGASSAIAAAALHAPAARADEESGSGEDDQGPAVSGEERRRRAFDTRLRAALAERAVPIPDHVNNGDEKRYSNRIGNHSKDLLHDAIGEVDPAAYDKLLTAVSSGDPRDFADIPIGGSVKLADPQGGLVFNLQGTDSAQLGMPAAPALASAERAGEMVEDYWMALTREIPFSRYGNEPLARAAIDELNRLSHFTGPRERGQVTPGTLFRGSAPGDLVGPYISQFLVQPARFGGVSNTTQKYNTSGPKDFLTTFPQWLACQNGQPPFEDPVAATPGYLKSGRDLAAYDHVDYAAQPTVTAMFWLLQRGVPLNPGNPYRGVKNQQGAPSFGNQHLFSLLYETSILASRAVFYQKWFVHRALRPEAYGGLVHNTLTRTMDYPLHGDVLGSAAVVEVHRKYGSYLLPHADPEGCPQHPAYAAQHSATLGAQVTVLKAFFDGSVVLRDVPIPKNAPPVPAVPSDDGQTLLPYTGADAGEMTVAGELNKLASNVSLGRDIEGVHWRSDSWQGMLLGEAAAISILRDQRRSFNERFAGFTFTTFQGKTITV